MSLSSLILQVPMVSPDSLPKNAEKLKALTDSIAASPQKLQDLQSFDWNGVISKLVDVGLSLGMRLLAAILVFIAGRFIVMKIHNLLRAIMLSRNVDRSLTTFLLSLFKITFFFVLAIIVISIIGIETSSFIAIFASAGIAIGMAFSGTLQNFAGGVLILLLKPYKVGDYIEYDKYQGFVKEIQIFHTIITTYNNESIIIPNGGLSTGTINNYSREKFRRVEWRVSVPYGSDVDVARKVILDLLEADSRILKPGSEDANSSHDDKDELPSDSEIEKMPWYKRLFYKHKKNREKLDGWREEKRHELEDKLPKVNFTPYVALENLDDSAVVLVVRAWCIFGDYWGVLYDINEAVYKQLPANGVHFPFPQLDVHIKEK
ncbi:MAG: mechanosensitive ion channel [Muribaculaceae bacterium]|nr:mechanosensitive ion channel [Muribaculaceae bacterium]